MAKVIHIAKKLPPLDTDEEPCSKCTEGRSGKCTCERARIWWDNFAKQFGDSRNG